MDHLQQAMNNAIMEVLGFASERQLLDSVPADQRLPDGADHQAQVNHAFAHAFGFKNVDDMLMANGMKGQRTHAFKA